MKTKLSALIIAIVALNSSSAVLAAGPAGGSAGFGTRPVPCCTNPVVQALSAEESATLLWMREEEKLARDVYLSLNAKWQDRVFKSIAVSEQRHFDALATKITLFGLRDPALPTVGDFANADLQVLYDALLTSGQSSLGQALSVGATIEDLDIRDLLNALENTTNVGLQTTYRNLLEGSKNHLRIFVSRLQALGLDYTPQYMDPVLFDAIVGN